MGKAASKAGWLIFIVALVGAAVHSGRDDPITAGLKSAGLDQPLIIMISIFVVLVLIYVLMLMRSTVAMRQHLEQLKRKGR